jgi:hypothetical protein
MPNFFQPLGLLMLNTFKKGGSVKERLIHAVKQEMLWITFKILD